MGPIADPGAGIWSRLNPPGSDRTSALLIIAGFFALYVPTFLDWAAGNWGGERQGHEPLIVLVSVYLLLARRGQSAGPAQAGAHRAAAGLLALGLLTYVLGRAAEVVRLELFSMILVLMSVLLGHGGWRAVRINWFALFFLLFAIPLPPDVVTTITGPLKSAVSAVAAKLLYWFGLPVGRSGVIITIGQYQLLVAEACAGLQTMFTLEAMGLLYASLSRHSPLHNFLLGVLVVPIAFIANVVRVMILVLVTYNLGDAAGQGFLHEFSGVVLFLVALVLIMTIDGLLRRLPLTSAKPS